MSYDFYIRNIDEPEGYWVANYTSNARTAFNWAFDQEKWHDRINGVGVRFAAKLIRDAVAEWNGLSETRQNIIWPKREWGDPRSAFSTLEVVAWHCEQTPYGSTLEINW